MAEVFGGKKQSLVNNCKILFLHIYKTLFLTQYYFRERNSCYELIMVVIGNFLAVQWLRLHTANAGDIGSIAGWGTKIPDAIWPETQNIKQKQ